MLYRNEPPSKAAGVTQVSLGGRTIGVKDRDGTLAALLGMRKFPILNGEMIFIT